MSDVIQQLNEIPNIAQFIADKIERMILEGEVEPGSRLVQTELADQFGVSRLPVRDALAILDKKNLLKQLPRKGMVVRTISEDEVSNLFEHRFILETYVTRHSIDKLSPEDIKKAEALIADQEATSSDNIIGLLDADEAFHRHLWSRYHNTEVLDALRSVWRRIKIVRAFARGIPNWKENSIKGHKRIVSAIRKGQYDVACSQLERGINRSRTEIFAKLRQTVS